MDDDRPLWGVDRSWSNLRYKTNADGELYESAHTKMHLDNGDSAAKCSTRILLNALRGDRSAGTVAEFERESPGLICRRCVPRVRA